jgi:hypothetical protein
MRTLRSALLLGAAMAVSVTLVGVAGIGAAGAASGAPIKIVTYGDITGLGPTVEHEFQDGVVAAVDAFNASGGVQGRKIDLTTCNTMFSAADAAACVANAKSDGVVAAIPSISLIDNVTTPLLEKQGIPLLGSDPSTPQALFSKTSACFLPGPFVDYPALTADMAKLGVKSFSSSLPLGVAGENILEGATQIEAASVGATIHAWLTISPVATSFAPIAAQAVAAGETGFEGSTEGPGLPALLSAALQAKPGLKLGGPAYIVQGGPSVDADLVTIPGVKGMTLSSYTALPTDNSVPGVKLFHQEINKVNSSDDYSEIALMTWLDGYGATQILKTIKSGPINSATITKALQHASNINLLGVVPNYSYKYNTLGLGCVVDPSEYQGALENANGAVAVNGGKPTFTLPASVIKYYKAHESTLQG